MVPDDVVEVAYMHQFEFAQEFRFTPEMNEFLQRDMKLNNRTKQESADLILQITYSREREWLEMSCLHLMEQLFEEGQEALAEDEEMQSLIDTDGVNDKNPN
ncbi:MAG: hypothetical protein RH917_07850 [Lacipirellulaceae bacterium]